MSARITIVYVAGLRAIARAVEAGSHPLAGETRLRRVDAEVPNGDDPEVTLRDLEWADGIAFGTPARERAPSPALMRFLDRTEQLWTSGRLYDKAVTVFTDSPEAPAPDEVIFPLYTELYHWGAVVIGPRDFELSLIARAAARHARPKAAARTGEDPRLEAAEYRGRRLAQLAAVLAHERQRREQLEV